MVKSSKPFVYLYQSCQSGQVPARRLAGEQAGCQARLTFEILAWPDPSTLYLAWPAGQARLKLLAWIRYSVNFTDGQLVKKYVILLSSWI